MATDLDIFAIKERIVDILDSNSTLYDATGANGKVRKIEAGAPDLGKIARESILPHIFVTNDTVIENIKHNTIVQGNATKMQEHQIGFQIILVADGKDGPTAEEAADDFAKLIKESIAANYDLRKPSDGSDPKVSRCSITQHGILNQSLFGSSKQGRYLKLQATAYTS